MTNGFLSMSNGFVNYERRAGFADIHLLYSVWPCSAFETYSERMKRVACHGKHILQYNTRPCKLCLLDDMPQIAYMFTFFLRTCTLCVTAALIGKYSCIIPTLKFIVYPRNSVIDIKPHERRGDDLLVSMFMNTL